MNYEKEVLDFRMKQFVDRSRSNEWSRREMVDTS